MINGSTIKDRHCYAGFADVLWREIEQVVIEHDEVRTFANFDRHLLVLQRHSVGAINRDSQGKIHLKNDSAYVPGNDKEAQFQILGASVADLLDTLDFNLQADNGETRLQLTTAYNNISESAV